MTTVTGSVSSSRPAKMQRTELAHADQLDRDNLPAAVQRVVASFLSFTEASYFLGKTHAPKFEDWQRGKQGISTEDWHHSKKDQIPHSQWDKNTFNKICKYMARISEKPWLKNLAIRNLAGDALEQFVGSRFPYLESLTLKFLQASRGYVSNHQAIAQLVKSAPKLSRVSVENLNEEEVGTVIQHAKNLSSLRVYRLNEKSLFHNVPDNLCNWSLLAEKLSKCSLFQRLELMDSCRVRGMQLGHLSAIPKVKTITLDDPGTRDDDILKLKFHQGLEEVRMVRLANVTNGTIHPFCHLPQLRSLEMEMSDNYKGTVVAIEHFEHAHKLSRLVLQKFPFFDLMAHGYLHKIPTLTSVKFIECKGLTDQGLSALSMCPRLEQIEIINSTEEITDKGVEGLASLTLLFLRLSAPAPAKQETISKQFSTCKAWKGITTKPFQRLLENNPSLQLLHLPRFAHWKNDAFSDVQACVASLNPKRKTPVKLKFGNET